VTLMAIVVGASVLTDGGVSGGRGFEFTTYQGDAIVQVGAQSLSDITGQGRPVLLNFWAGNCPPCRAEMPAFQSAYEQFGYRIVFLGVDVGPFTGLGSKRDGEALLQELGITYPIATTRSAQAVNAYGVISMPTTGFFNAEGNVHRTWSGAMTETSSPRSSENWLTFSRRDYRNIIAVEIASSLMIKYRSVFDSQDGGKRCERLEL